MNPYLKRLQDQYNSLKTSIEGLQNRAVSDNRDLTEDELRSVNEQSETAKSLYGQIETLMEIETRNSKVAELASKVGGESQTENRALGVTAQERDPGHYVKNGSHSFFGDMYRAKSLGDDDASLRLTQHNRALSTGTNGPGVVPPKWLTEEFELLARQGRALSNAVRNIPLGDDPRPLTLPKQTAGTDAEVTEQASENTAVEDDDAWDSDVDTVTPKPTAGLQIVSRQMLDMSSPAIDQLIYGDLIAAYNTKIEAKVGTAVLAVGTASTGNESDFGDMTAATNGVDLAVAAAIAVRSARKLPANILAMTVDRYGEFLKMKDAQGRPLMPGETAGPMNVIGVGTVDVDGRIKNMGVIATDGMDDPTANKDTFAAVRTQDVLLFESNMLRFRYEEPLGPESVKLGIWAYAAVLVRQGTKAVKRVTITTNA